MLKANRKETPEEVISRGDYCIFNLSSNHPMSGITFCCPHEGCGDITHLPLKPFNDRGWTWCNYHETLTPSIQRQDSNRCEHHFSLIKGRWVP